MNATYLAIAILAITNILLIGILAYFVHKLLSKENSQKSLPIEDTPLISSPENKFKKIKKIEAPDPKFVCAFHPERDPVGVCAICEQSLCESCLREWEHLNFCSEHLKTYAENKWEYITNEQTTPTTVEKSAYIYDFKRALWKDSIPTFIVTHYKIEIENDNVESYVQLFVRTQDSQKLKLKLEDIKKGASQPLN
ncbi:MAG: hypothetical protein Fur0010_09560 [Bdellovibrio sp.]